MEETKRSSFLRILIVLSFLLMVAVNALAMLLPINEKTTAEISDSYPNLFAPAGITFSVWSVIYVLLAAYAVYQIIFFSKNRDADSYLTMRKVGVVFVLSSLINTVWIFSWHYEQLLLSVALMLGLLLCLILIRLFLRKKNLSLAEKILVRLPFSIYFGWITVATIANITTYLVSIDWSGFGLSASLWTVIILIVGTLIAFATVLFAKDPVYGLTVIWAFAGIIIKHMDASGHDRAYMSVVITACVCIAILLLECVVIAVFGKLPSGSKKSAPFEEKEFGAISDSADTPKEEA